MGHVVSAENDLPPTDSTYVGTALIVTPNHALAALLTDALQSVAVAAERCEGTVSCFDRVKKHRFEVAFIDFDVAASAIDAVRSSPSTRTAVVIAITANADQSNRAFACGVHFVIEQPVSRSSVDGIIRAAYGLIIRERRRYFRCPVEIEIVAHRRTEGAWPGRTVNVSEGGMCVVAPVTLEPKESLELEFKLPFSSVEISADCDVQWVDDKGRVGLRFVRMSQECKSDLMHWLTDQLDKRLKPALLAFERVPEVAVAAHTARFVPELKAYQTPQVDRYKAIDELPTKLRTVAEDILHEQPALKILLDEEHRNVSVSEEFARLLGYSSRDLVGKPIDEISSKEAMDIDFMFRVLGRFRETKGLWLFEGRRGKKLLCSYRATRFAERVIMAEFKPLLVAV